MTWEEAKLAVDGRWFTAHRFLSSFAYWATDDGKPACVIGYYRQASYGTQFSYDEKVIMGVGSTWERAFSAADKKEAHK